MKQTSQILFLTVLLAVSLSWAQSNLKTDSVTSAAARPLKAADKDDSSSEESGGKGQNLLYRINSRIVSDFS